MEAMEYIFLKKVKFLNIDPYFSKVIRDNVEIIWKEKGLGLKSREKIFRVRWMINAKGFKQERCGNEREEENVSHVGVEWMGIGALSNVD